MSYVATVLARNSNTWTAFDVDLDDAEDIDGVVDVIRAVDEGADTALLFLDEEDEYLAVVRVDGSDGVDDPRVFLSDGHAIDSFELPALLVEGLALDEPDDSSDDEDEDTPSGHDSDPIGDASLLADLGTPESVLLKLCTAEGTLPADVVTSIAERAGFLDEVEAVRA